MKKLKNDISNNYLLLIFILLYFILMQLFFHTICPFYAIFHFPCPGCGLTRACLLLFIGRFNESFSYNPTAIFWIVSIACLIIDRYIKELKIKPFPFMFIITSMITLLWYFIRIFILRQF